MKKLILNIFFFLMVISLSECTVNQRHYRDGYQVSWTKKKSKIKVENNNQPKEQTLKVLDVIKSDQLLQPQGEM